MFWQYTVKIQIFILTLKVSKFIFWLIFWNNKSIKSYHSNISQPKTFTDVLQSNLEHLWLNCCINEYGAFYVS